jgi:hypothetical protein
MISFPFAPTRTQQSDSRTQRAVYWVLCLLIAAAMVVAASGSGNPATAEPLPDWVNTGANLLCLIIAAFALLPRTRVWGALAAALNMLASVATNVLVDGAAYAMQVLPFNLATLALRVAVIWHHRKDNRRKA